MGRLVFLLLALLLWPLQAGAQQTRIRVTLQLPISGHVGQNLVQFKTEVEARSGGTITVEIFDNSGLYEDSEALGAVASGAIEMAMITSQQLTREVPAIGILEVPFLLYFDAPVRATMAPESGMRALMDRAVMEATEVRVLWWQAYGSTVLFSKGKTARQPRDIQGRKIRVFGDNLGSFVQYCGGVPKLIAAAKQHQALKDGTVDYIMTGITAVDTRKLWEVSDTITRIEHAAIELPIIINEKVWQSLGAPGQAIILQAAKKVERDLRGRMADIEAKAYAFARSKRMRIEELAPDEVYEWRACGAPLLNDFIRDAGELGPRLMAAYGRLRVRPCCGTGPAGPFSMRRAGADPTAQPWPRDPAPAR